MRRQTLERMLAQVMELSALDAARLEAAVQRFQAAESELKQAREELDLMAGRASSSDTLRATLQERLQQTRPAGPQAEGTAADGEAGQRRISMAQAIREFLRERGEATLSQITQYIEQVRPDVKSRNTGPELSRMVRRGQLVRTGVACYRLTVEETATDRH